MSIRVGNQIVAGTTKTLLHADLFDWKWADHELNNQSWLRADTFSWQPGSKYRAAYQHLVDEIYIAYIMDVGSPDKYYRMSSDDVDGALHPYAWGDSGLVAYYTDSETPSATDSLYSGANDSTATSTVDEYGLDVTLTPQTETIAGTTITYYQATDGHKICPTSEESNVAAIYTATGVAWYYIIDISNNRFKLPRTQYGVTGLRDTVGNYVPESLPNITGNEDDVLSQNAGGAFRKGSGNYKVNPSTTASSTAWFGRIDFDASRSSSAYQNDAPVQQRATQQYLYFYVGEFTQTALSQTAGLNTELFNNKVDITSSWGQPSDTYDSLTLGSSGTVYTAPADGYFTIACDMSSGNGNIGMGGTGMSTWGQISTAGYIDLFLPCSKGGSVAIWYKNLNTVRFFRFVYAKKTN